MAAAGAEGGREHGSPGRAATIDPRLVGMPEGMTKKDKSDWIKRECRLDDDMWNHVYCHAKKGPNVRWECMACGALWTGGPAKIVAHFLKDVKGCVTCTATGPIREAANEAADDYKQKENAAKQKRADMLKRKAQADALRAADAARKKQQMMSASGRQCAPLSRRPRWLVSKRRRVFGRIWNIWDVFGDVSVFT